MKGLLWAFNLLPVLISGMALLAANDYLRLQTLAASFRGPWKLYPEKKMLKVMTSKFSVYTMDA